MKKVDREWNKFIKNPLTKEPHYALTLIRHYGTKRDSYSGIIVENNNLAVSHETDSCDKIPMKSLKKLIKDGYIKPIKVKAYIITKRGNDYIEEHPLYCKDRK